MAASKRLESNESRFSTGVDRAVAWRYVSRFFNSQPAALRINPQPSVKLTEKEMEQVNIKPNVDIQLSDLKLALGPELKGYASHCVGLGSGSKKRRVGSAPSLKENVSMKHVAALKANESMKPDVHPRGFF